MFRMVGRYFFEFFGNFKKVINECLSRLVGTMGSSFLKIQKIINLKKKG
jgi:hypothetical protein